MHSRGSFKPKTYTAILMIFEGQFQVFQRFSSSKLVLKTVESCFAGLNYYENGSTYAGITSLMYVYGEKMAVLYTLAFSSKKKRIGMNAYV